MTTDRFLRKHPNPVSLDALRHPEYDVRDYRNDEDIDNIRRSMERKGQIMPILLGSKDGDQYPILDGNHRFLAAKRAGWPDIDAIQTEAGVQDNEAQIIANISRLELSQSEKLATFDYLLNVLDYSQTEAAEAVGFDRSQVTRYASVLTGYGEIKEFFVQGEIGVGAAYQLNMVEDRDRAVDIAERAVKEQYTDSTVKHQAKFARKPSEHSDEMRGAGTERNVKAMQQAKRNAQAMDDLQPIDERGLQEASVAQSESPGPGAAEGDGEAPTEADGEPCMGCGEPMVPGPMSHVQIHPELAQELGIAELHFGNTCTAALIEWWAAQQQQAEVQTADPGAGD
jgi:ParB/RepB/Spo0J family partition protein